MLDVFYMDDQEDISELYQKVETLQILRVEQRKVDGQLKKNKKKNKGCVLFSYTIWKLVWSEDAEDGPLVTRNVKQKGGALVSFDFAVLGSVKR